MTVVTHPWGSTDWQLPVIGQGTWRMEEDEREPAIRALRRGLDLGLTHVDTAEIYGDGAVEVMVGEAIAGRRDEVFLVSKVTPTHASYEGTLRACEGSLERLGTDHLDGYLLHWPGPYPLEETFRAFEQLVKDGKVRSWGVSNFGVEELERAVAVAGEGRMACNQVLYHLEERGMEEQVLPWCEAHHVSVVAYNPYGHVHTPAPSSYVGRLIGELAHAHHATPVQVVLAFLTRRPSQFAIPRASREQHAEEYAGAARLRLSPRQVARLEVVLSRATPEVMHVP